MTDRPHITPTNYKRKGAAKLMSYMNKNNATLRNRVGQKMPPEEQQEFMHKSDYHEFTRGYVISPKKNDLTDEEMQEAVRDSITDYFDGESVDFCYAIHDPEKVREESDELHAHVAITGTEDDLRMDKDDIRGFNQQSEEVFQQVEREYEILRKLKRTEELEEELEEEQELEWEQALH